MVSRCGQNDLAYCDRIEAATGPLTLLFVPRCGSSSRAVDKRGRSQRPFPPRFLERIVGLAQASLDVLAINCLR